MDDVRAVLDGSARWAVVCTDALEMLDMLPSRSVRAIVTDPPYCSGAFSEVGRRAAKGQGKRSEMLREGGWFTNDDMGTSGLVWLLRAVAGEARRVLVDGGSLVVFCDWRMIANLAPALESAGLRHQNVLVWNKGSMGLGNGFRAQHEIALHFTRGGFEAFAADTGNVLTVPRVARDEAVHHTEKPLDLMRSILRVVSGEGEVVVDPFAGSGATLVAALSLGMRAVGSELDADNARKATARCEAVVDGRDWRKPEQTSLFGGSR